MEGSEQVNKEEDYQSFTQFESKFSKTDLDEEEPSSTDSSDREAESEKKKRKNVKVNLNENIMDKGYCKHCRKTYKTAKEHREFVSTHEERKYYCRDHPTCTEKYARHELLIHCKEYGITIPDIRQYFQKARCKATRIKNLEGQPCEICSKMFQTKDALEDHYNSHEDQYLCATCNTGFKKIMDYVCHMQAHSNDKLLQCPICSVTMEKMYQMRVHISRSHDQFKRFKCNICEKRFPYYTVYYEHVKYFHSGEKTFVCDICGKRFIYSSYLASHKVIEHKSESAGVHECTECLQKFTKSRFLQRHLQKAHPKTLLVCDICGREFKSKKYLTGHLKVHNNDKRHQCSYCEMKFITSSSRNEHERVHTGHRPYNCSYCKKAFTQRNSLVIHLRNHTGERPYVCHLCNRGYTSKTGLVNHMRNCNGANLNNETLKQENI